MFLDPLVFIASRAGARQSTERFLLMSAGISLHSLGPAARGDTIGKAIIEDLPVEGSKEMLTSPGGAVLFESWYAPTSKATVLFRITDSGGNETTIRLTNIKTAEPDASLFRIPANYRFVLEQSSFTLHDASH
jgi:hypothetical protein